MTKSETYNESRRKKTLHDVRKGKELNEYLGDTYNEDHKWMLLIMSEQSPRVACGVRGGKSD